MSAILSNLFLATSPYFLFFNDTATTEIYTLSLHDALPISTSKRRPRTPTGSRAQAGSPSTWRSEEHTSELQSRRDLVCRLLLEKKNINSFSAPCASLSRSFVILSFPESEIVSDDWAGGIIRAFAAAFSFSASAFTLFFFVFPLPPKSILFPYTTLFR